MTYPVRGGERVVACDDVAQLVELLAGLQHLLHVAVEHRELLQTHRQPVLLRRQRRVLVRQPGGASIVIGLVVATFLTFYFKHIKVLLSHAKSMSKTLFLNCRNLLL